MTRAAGRHRPTPKDASLYVQYDSGAACIASAETRRSGRFPVEYLNEISGSRAGVHIEHGHRR